MNCSLPDWLAHLDALHPLGAAGIELGLERVREISRILGQTHTVPVITVGGTNGKGSTCAMLERILQCAGYRVGLYTSPHLLEYNERVRIDGMVASDEALCAAFSRVEAARKTALPLTYFEFGTLAAWECFAAAKLDAIILEVGLGGRLDAVNIYDADCAIVTGIAIDHTDHLGLTRDDISFEKAGIFRAGHPAICADPAPPQRLLDHASAIGADLRRIGKDFGYAREKHQWRYWGSQGERTDLPLPSLRGKFQLQNASAALAALDALRELLPVTTQDICRGLTEAELMGRFQVLPGKPAVILDVAHNPQAAEMLAENLDNMPSHAETWAVFGMLRDKDIAAVARALRGRVTRWLPCSLAGPRATNAVELGQILTCEGIDGSPLQFDSPGAAFRYARNNAGEDDRILVFGSFLTVAEILRSVPQLPRTA